MDTKALKLRIRERLTAIYGYFPLGGQEFEELIGSISSLKDKHGRRTSGWDEGDIILITYGDSIRKKGERPLASLSRFLDDFLSGSVSCVHILPFFPFSSDDGFSVIDFYEVNPELGSWDDIGAIGKSYGLMVDLVINHVSRQSLWFRNYLQGKDPGMGYFIEEDPGTDLSLVVRPRSLPLLSAYDTWKGRKYLWTTFSADQLDLNFGNPMVLMEMIRVFLFYLSKGARIIRLDAIAFLWKKAGTSCLHLPQTHLIVKLLRDIAGFIDPGIILLTETNVPNQENLSYFGEGDEAQMVYQFSLPPLLLHALFNGDSTYLTGWCSSMDKVPGGCTFFNFTASHDGIGVRPLEGILTKEEILGLAKAMERAGGHISTKRNKDGSDSPYELNITYFDAMKFTRRGADRFQTERFICSQTLMLSFRGIPAFYIHSLLGTANYHQGVEQTGMPRSINRRKWDDGELRDLLNPDSSHAFLLKELTRRIKIRKGEAAFHPDSPQEVFSADSRLFIMCRGADKELTVIANLSSEEVDYQPDAARQSAVNFLDILSGERVTAVGLKLLPYQVCWLKK